MKKLLFLFFVLSISQFGRAANLVDARPLTNKVIMLSFVDGYFTYHQLGQTRDKDAVTLYPGGRIPTATAKTAGIYSITSADDANYAIAVSPLSIGVKQQSETGWDSGITSQKYVQTTNCFLMLNTPLVAGKTYTITVNDVSINATAKTKTFTFDTKSIRSEAVHVNNVGYVPGAPSKFAYVYLWMGDKGSLDLTKTAHITTNATRKARLIRTSDNVEVFNCDIVFRKDSTQTEFGQWGTPNNNFLGASVWECDFSSFNTPGNYVMAVDDIGCSFPFDINNNVYFEPFYWVLKNIHENRSGIELKKPFSQYNRPAPHQPGVTPGFKLYYSSVRHFDLLGEDANKDDIPAIDAAIKGEVDAWGWYQDAADWDAYQTHYKVPAGLMFLYETNPAIFNTLNLNFEDESANNLPDLLDEARWLLRFYKRSKDAIKNPTLGGTGGVPGGRIFGDLYANSDGTKAEDGRGSWQDTKRKWVMLGENVWQTYQYAALAAHFAHILQANSLTDPEGINWEQEAKDAWTWAQSHQVAGDETPKWDYNLAYFRMYAASALYRLTGEKSTYEPTFIYDYNNSVVDSYTGFPTNYEFINNNDTRSFLFTMYSLAAKKWNTADATIKSKVEACITTSTNYLVGSNSSSIKNRATRWGGGWWLPMGFGQSTVPYCNLATMSMLSVGASNTTLANDWLKNMYTTADYFLGTNPLNMTMISGVGDRSIEQFFHIDAFYCSNTSAGAIPKKGFIPYGTMRDCQQDLGSCWAAPGAYMYYYGQRYGKAYPNGTDDQNGGVGTPRPGHERFFSSRTSPLANENTIHQTQLSALLTYGYLFAKTGTQGAISTTGVAVNPTTVSIMAGSTSQLTATVSPANATNSSVEWSTNDAAIATVSNTGLVSAKYPGSVTITATTNDGSFMASTIVTVTAETPAVKKIATLFVADLTGTAPAQNRPWTATSQLDERITYSGLNLGRSTGEFQGWTANNEFQMKSGYGTKSTLAVALANKDYISFSIAPTAGNTLCLNNAELKFKSKFNSYDFGTKWVVFTSIGGFTAGNEIFTSDKINFYNTALSTTTLYFPSTGYSNITTPIEVRIYAVDAFWGNLASITAMSLTGTFDGTTPAKPIYTASSVYNNGANIAAFAFDGASDKLWQSNLTSGWLQVQLPEPVIYNTYNLYIPTSGLTNMPKNWTIEGSKNGTDWTILDTQTNQTQSAASTKDSYNSVQYSFLNAISFDYYRMNITANNGGWQVFVADIEYSFKMGITTAVEKQTTDYSISVFPTKVTDKLTIKLDEAHKNATISVADLQGRTLLVENVFEKHNIEVNVASLENGIYLLKISQGNNFVTRKFVKQ